MRSYPMLVFFSLPVHGCKAKYIFRGAQSLYLALSSIYFKPVLRLSKVLFYIWFVKKQVIIIIEQSVLFLGLKKVHTKVITQWHLLKSK